MKFGLMASLLRVPVADAIPLARRLGFEGLEVDLFHREDARPGGSLSASHRFDMRARAASEGLVLTSVCPHFLNQGGPADGDPKVRATAREAIREAIELAADLGARVVLIPFFGPGEIDGQSGCARAADELRTLAREAFAARVTLAIEHHLPAATAASLLDSIGSAGMGVYWDMGNCCCFGYDPIEEVRLLGSRIVQVHAKDYSGPEKRDRPGHYPGLNRTPLGEGEVPIEAVLRALRAIGYDQWLVLETGIFGDPAESATFSLAVLKRLWAGLG